MAAKYIAELDATTKKLKDDQIPASVLSADSPALTGNPTAPTASPGDNDTTLATTAFVTGGIATHSAATDPHGDRAYTDGQVAAALAALGSADWKSSARVATTANITLSGAQTIDGVSAIAGDRVLVKDQSTGSQNGLYVVASGAWSRSSDADTSAEVTSGLGVVVEQGSANGGKVFLLTTTNPITLGSTTLTFTAISAGGGGGAVATDTIWDTKGDIVAATGADAAAKLAIGSAGQFLTPDTSASNGLKWANYYGESTVGACVSGLYYSTRYASSGTAGFGAGDVGATPIIITRTTTFDRIAVYVRTGVASTLFRLAIFTSNADGTPSSTCLLDAGTVAGDTVTQVEATISQQLTPGLYYLAAARNTGGASPPGLMIPANTSRSTYIGATSLALAFSTTALLSYNATGVTGAFGAVTWTPNGDKSPVFALRAA